MTAPLRLHFDGWSRRGGRRCSVHVTTGERQEALLAEWGHPLGDGYRWSPATLAEAGVHVS